MFFEMQHTPRRAFTLIELLVVIAIVGILSAAVLAAVGSARDRANIARAKAEMKEFAKAVDIAQGEANMTLFRISSIHAAPFQNCAQCACNGLGDLRNIATSTDCYRAWTLTLGAVQQRADGLVSNITRMDRDPWGSPYLLDQNQGEGGCYPTRPLDTLRSAGPDGLMNTSDDIALTGNLPPPPVCP